MLIHSKSEFSEIIPESSKTSDTSHTVEIGAEFGGNSAMLTDFVAARDGALTSIDPAPKQDFVVRLDVK